MGQKVEHPSPLIYLNGIDKTELGLILEFLYTGEASIRQEDIDSFLKFTEDLKISGLKSYNNKPRIDGNHFSDIAEEVDTNLLNTSKPDTFKLEIIEEVTNKQLESRLDAIIDEKSIKGKGVWQCKDCGKTLNKRGNLKHHIEAVHIENVSHSCQFCNKTSQTRHSLNVHIHDYHRSALTFSCKVCNTHDLSKRQFRQHKRSCNLPVNL